MSRRSRISALLVLLVFGLITVVRHFGSLGEDLSSSYYGCRMLATHQPQHLFSRDSWDFSKVADPLWDRMATATGFRVIDHLHPYVQTPLWAYSIQPLCTSMNFPAFNKVFFCLMATSLVLTIWLVGRYWAPRTLRPGPMALVCALLYFSEAYQQTTMLNQTHPLFVALAIAALVCAEDERPLLAGLLLSVAAAVKITPGLLLVYWLVQRRWAASVSFVGFFVILAGVSVLTTGWALNEVYLANLKQVSNMLLVSFNNQSLASAWQGHLYPPSELHQWHAYALPKLVKNISLLCALASVVTGAWLDRTRAATTYAPWGAAFAMVGLAVFTPLSWSHYYVLLVFPLMLAYNALLDRRSLWGLAFVLIVLALNFDTDVAAGRLHPFLFFSVVRAQFWGGLCCMAGLAYFALRERVTPARWPRDAPAPLEQVDHLAA